MMSRKYGKVTHLVDVYSFAMVALELVSLKLPFDDWEEFQPGRNYDAFLIKRK